MHTPMGKLYVLELITYIARNALINVIRLVVYNIIEIKILTTSVTT